MDQRAKDIKGRGDALYNKRQSLDSLWQEIAENFYPERADFTVSRSLGDELVDELYDSYPLIARRDLGNSISAMLRPKGTEWFHIGVAGPETVDVWGKRWLEAKTRSMRRAMYARAAQFTRATKEADHDFATFGQCVLSVEMNSDKTDFLFRCWHLRDVVWAEGRDGTVDEVHRRWKAPASVLVKLFSKTISTDVQDIARNAPFKEIDVRHIVIRSDEYHGEGDKKFNTKYVSLYIDVARDEVIEETGINHPIYVVPRWQTVSGSQYAHSPATVVALADARQLQTMSRVLIEAGEKTVDPPMIATQEAVRSDMALFAGGVTWVDSAYDEKLGAALRPITQDRSGLPIGLQMQAMQREMISEAFYLNKLNLPPAGGAMTAYEVSQRIQEFIRSTMPLFEPMEDDYNGQLCEATFELGFANGLFGSVKDIPESLSGRDIEFKFESPLHDAIDRAAGARFQEASEMLAVAAQLDPNTIIHIDPHTALRDSLDKIGVPQKWITPEDDAAKQLGDLRAAEGQAQVMQQLESVTGAVQGAGEAAQAVEAVS